MVVHRSPVERLSGQLEVLRDGENGLTADFFAHRALANRIEAALEDPGGMAPLRRAARTAAVKNFDLRDTILPRWERLLGDLVHHRRPAV